MLVGVLEPSVRYHSQGARILTKERTVSGGQFDWGGRLQKGNGGVQRFLQTGWKSVAECKGRKELDCENYSSAGWKHGLSDPTVLCGRAVAQRIKVTLGITG